MLPRMIATDLDGTFLDPEGKYDHERFDQLLVKLAQRGSRLVIATGDPLDHVLDLFSSLPHANLLTYVVENGGVIADGSGRLIETTLMPHDLAYSAMEWLKTEPLMADNHLIACGVTRAYTEMAPDSERFKASQVYYPSLTTVEDVTAIPRQFVQLDVTWEVADAQDKVDAFNRKFEKLQATNCGMGGMSVALPSMSKAAALASLSRAWQIPADQMAAFGDSGNDVIMLKLVGQGLAVANAAPDVLAFINRHTAGTNADGAVMQQIEDWLG